MKKVFAVLMLVMFQFSWTAQQSNSNLDIQNITKTTSHERGTVTIHFFFALKNGQKGTCSKYLNCKESDYSRQYSYAQNGAFIADDPAESWYQLFHAYDVMHRIKKNWVKK